MSERRLNKNTLADVDPNISLCYKPVIISDSKGRYLKLCVDKNSPLEENVQWYYQSGSNSSNVLQWVQRNVPKLNSKYGKVCLYIWIGTCDLTLKQGRVISLHPHVEQQQKKLEDNLTLINTICKDNGVKTVFLHLPYYSIKIWCATKGCPSSSTVIEDDKILSSTIDNVNHFIDDLNSVSNVMSPKLNQDLVRSRKSRGRKARYSLNFNLLSDGIHPTKSLARSWLVSIIRNIARTCV